jgi:hypothetical protein
MDRLYRSNADDADSIRAMTLSDYVSDDYSTDDGTECEGEYVEPRQCNRRNVGWSGATDVSLERTRRSGVR